MNAAIKDVLAERQRQKDVEGWTPEHDDAHVIGELALAAATYLIYSMARELPDPAGPDKPSWKYSLLMHANSVWPWVEPSMKPKNRRLDLVRAAALAIAEIERLDRAAEAHPVPMADSATCSAA